MKPLLTILTFQLDRIADVSKRKNTYARCKRKARKTNVTIKTERDGYWLIGTGWEDDNFCSDWDEVEEKLNRLLTHR